MAPQRMWSVGLCADDIVARTNRVRDSVVYTGFSSLSLINCIVGSRLTFRQHGRMQPNSPFSHFFGSARTSTSRVCSLPTIPLSICADIERLYDDRKLLKERKPLLLPAAQSNRSFSVASISQHWHFQ